MNLGVQHAVIGQGGTHFVPNGRCVGLGNVIKNRCRDDGGVHIRFHRQLANVADDGLNPFGQICTFSSFADSVEPSLADVNRCDVVTRRGESQRVSAGPSTQIDGFWPLGVGRCLRTGLVQVSSQFRRWLHAVCDVFAVVGFEEEVVGWVVGDSIHADTDCLKKSDKIELSLAR